MSRVEILYGPPGTGKTTTLLDAVDAFLEAGGDPARIVFSSYTRYAARQAAARAAERFGLDEDALPYFRTLHSLAFHSLGLKRADVVRLTDYRDVARSLGLVISGQLDLDQWAFHPGTQRGDECALIHAWQRARRTTLTEAWRSIGSGNVSLAQVEEFVRVLDSVKEARHRLDFADMLDACHTALDVDLVIIDEAQDLSPAQWEYARRMAKHAHRVIVAGDDDQAIYDFAGADSRVFQTVLGTRRVLTQSHRLARPIHGLAEAITTQIKTRVEKVYAPAEHPGMVRTVPTLDHVQLHPGERYLLLARHNSQLADYVRLARAQGVVYHVNSHWSTELPAVRLAVAYEKLRRGEGITAELAGQLVALVPGATWRIAPGGNAPVRWHGIAWPFEGRPEWYTALVRLDGDDVAYIRALRRNGVSLRGAGTVHISTIHGAKGGEAAHVVLLTDVSSRTYNSAWRSGDAEARVWYVGATRAEKTLTLVRASGPRVWPGWPALGVSI